MSRESAFSFRQIEILSRESASIRDSYPYLSCEFRDPHLGERPLSRESRLLEAVAPTLSRESRG